MDSADLSRSGATRDQQVQDNMKKTRKSDYFATAT